MNAEKARELSKNCEKGLSVKIREFLENKKYKRKYKERRKLYLKKIKNAALQGEYTTFISVYDIPTYCEYDEKILTELKEMGYKVSINDPNLLNINSVYYVKICWE